MTNIIDKLLTKAVKVDYIISNDKQRAYSMKMFYLLATNNEGLEDFLLTAATNNPEHIADLQHVIYNLYPQHKSLLDKILLLL